MKNGILKQYTKLTTSVSKTSIYLPSSSNAFHCKFDKIGAQFSEKLLSLSHISTQTFHLKTNLFPTKSSAA